MLMWLGLRSVREARLHAHVCGDGHLYVEVGRRGKRYVVEYTNSSLELINEFINDAIYEYNVSPIIIKHKEVFIARFKSRYAFHRLALLKAGKSKEWRAPLRIFLVADTAKAAELMKNWLRAFMDDEAHIDLSTGRVTITSVNYQGLLDIKDMLNYLGIKSKIYRILRGYAYKLVISKRENLCRLFSMITPLHPQKLMRSRKILLMCKALKG